MQITELLRRGWTCREEQSLSTSPPRRLALALWTDHPPTAVRSRISAVPP
jgi:hypothetical protein